MKKSLTIFVLLFFGLLSGLKAQITVPSMGYPDIQTALNTVPPGTIILLIPTLTYTENIVWPAKDGIVLDGDPGGSGIFATIDGGSNGLSVITIAPGSFNITNITQLKNLIITNGNKNGNGGGICIQGNVSPDLTNLNIIGNQCSGNGGGLSIEGIAAPTLSWSKIERNNCGLNGGGIYYEPRMVLTNSGTGGCYQWVTPGPMLMHDNEISFNNAVSPGNPIIGNGGGIYLKGTSTASFVGSSCLETDVIDITIDLTTCNIHHNRAIQNAGGIYAEYAYIKCTDVHIDENETGQNGGGMYTYKSLTLFDIMSIKGNRSNNKGGGVFLEGGIKNDNSNCLLCNNYYVAFASGIENDWSNVYFSGNRTSVNGGGIYTTGGTHFPSDYLDILYNNPLSPNGHFGFVMQNICESDGGGIYINDATKLSFFNVDISYNTSINGNGGGIFNNCAYDVVTNGPSNGEHNFEQCKISHNEANPSVSGVNGYGGGIYTKQSFSCINSSIGYNICHMDGAGMACVPYTIGGNPQLLTPVFHNTIFYDNTIFGVGPNQIYLSDDVCNPQFAFCSIRGWVNNVVNGFTGIGGGANWTPFTWTPPTPPINDILPGWDPLCQLLPGSLCIDVGDISLSTVANGNLNTLFGFPGYVSDMAYNSRVIGNIDLGVYEYGAKSSLFDPENPNNCLHVIDASIFPNPWNGSDNLILKINSKQKTSLKIEVVDLLGNSIKTIDVDLGSNEELSISNFLNSLSKGSYFIKIRYTDSFGYQGQITKKLVKS